MPLWNNRIAKSSNEHSLVEEQFAHLDRLRRLPQDDGHDGRFTWQRFEAQGDQALAEVACVLVESGHELGAGPAVKPPAAPPSALPSVDVMISTWPTMP